MGRACVRANKSSAAFLSYGGNRLFLLSAAASRLFERFGIFPAAVSPLAGGMGRVVRTCVRTKAGILPGLAEEFVP